MKVCYVTHLPNLTGASQSLLDILSKLDKDKVEAVVLLGKHGPLEEELNKLGIRYKIISYFPEVKNKRNFIINLMKIFANRITLPKIIKFYKEEGFDLIHNNSFLAGVGMEAAYKADIPYICHLRDFVWEDHKIKLLNEKKQYFYLSHANSAIAISNIIREKFQPMAEKTHFETIYDGIDISKYLNKNKKILYDKKVNLILAGRIAPGKGQLEAIKSMEELAGRKITNVRLQIIGGVGDESYASEIKNYVTSHKLDNVEFIEFTNDLYGLRAECDIGLVCSSAEAMGRVTLENMLTGCLTIGADAGATKELIRDGVTGLLYEQGNYTDLANKIIYAMENREVIREIAIKGQEYAVREFDSENYNDKLYELYQLVLK